MNHESAKQSPTPPRRHFLGKIAWLLLGLTAGTTATIVGIAGFGAALRRQTQKDEWSAVATLTELPEGKPIRFNVVVTERSGWLSNNTQEAIWVLRRGDQITAFSAVCPHAGCPIGLEARGFNCSCHGSSWSASGDKTGGPTPRNMDRLESRVRENILEIKYQRFKLGSSQKELNA